LKEIPAIILFIRQIFVSLHKYNHRGGQNQYGIKLVKMELSFDIRGNLKPYEVLRLEIPEFVSLFVDSFDPDSTRTNLYSNYKSYFSDLHQMLKYEFFQWIDGSFITTKRDPRDIDVVSFIDFKDYEEYTEIIDNRFSSKNARKIYGVDAYIVPKYPENHVRYAFFLSDFLYWRNFFGKTKVNRAKKQFDKAIVQINFD
jgi:hypothetical protein